MKKHAALFCSLLVWANAALAGDFYCQGWIDLYSPDGVLYFRGLTDKTATRGMFSSKGGDQWTKNIKVFDLLSGDSWKVFPVDFGSEHTITSIEFPPPADTTTHPFRNRLGNYRNLEAAGDATESFLVLVVRDKESAAETLFVADARGKNLRRITTVPRSGDWHLDQKNMALRVFRNVGQDIVMTAFSLLED